MSGKLEAIKYFVLEAQDLLGIKSDVKDKYQKFIESDKAFLASMGVPQEILDIKIIYKSHGLVDKTFYPLMKLGQFVFSFPQELKEMNELKYDGTNSMYGGYLDKDGKVLNEYIMMGINALEEKEMSTYKSLYKIYGNDEQKMTSFIFFHEFGHKIANALNNEEANLDKLVELFESEKDITLTKEDKKIIRTQYSETYADNFALMMMTKKYPEVNFEEARDLLAGLRLDNADATHLSSPGIIQAQRPHDNANLKYILIASEKGALATAEFYSPIDFTKTDAEDTNAGKRGTIVKLANLDITQVRNNLNNARDKFLTASKRDLPKYKE